MIRHIFITLTILLSICDVLAADGDYAVSYITASFF